MSFEGARAAQLPGMGLQFGAPQAAGDAGAWRSLGGQEIMGGPPLQWPQAQQAAPAVHGGMLYGLESLLSTHAHGGLPPPPPHGALPSQSPLVQSLNASLLAQQAAMLGAHGAAGLPQSVLASLLADSANAGLAAQLTALASGDVHWRLQQALAAEAAATAHLQAAAAAHYAYLSAAALPGGAGAVGVAGGKPPGQSGGRFRGSRGSGKSSHRGGRAAAAAAGAAAAGIRAPTWAGAHWHPMAAVVSSGQLASGGTGVFLPAAAPHRSGRAERAPPSAAPAAQSGGASRGQSFDGASTGSEEGGSSTDSRDSETDCLPPPAPAGGRALPDEWAY